MARVKKLMIRNILGIKELEIEPGKVTVIKGKNETGKTSLIEALKAVVEGGHDATLVREGEDEGETVLVLDDDVEIRKRITRDTATLDVRHPDMGKISAPQSYVNKLIDSLSFDPIKFLTSDDRVEILLEAVEVDLEAEDLLDAVEGVDPEGEEVDTKRLVEEAHGLPALDAIERVRGEIYNARTGVNRIVKDKKSTVKELRETLPEDASPPEEVEKAIEAIRGDVEEMTKAAMEEKEEVAAERDEEVAKIQDEKNERVAELQLKIREVEKEASDAIEQERADARQAMDEVNEQYDPQISAGKEKIAALEERLKASEGAERTRRMIERNEKIAAEKQTMSDEMTAAIERLETLKGKVLKDLPIEGAEIVDGELLVGGIPFDRINTAEKVRLAMQVAEHRSGDLGLVVVDNLEMLDTEHFEALTEELKRSPLQPIVTRVSDDVDELTVETVNGDDG